MAANTTAFKNKTNTRRWQNLGKPGRNNLFQITADNHAKPVNP